MERTALLKALGHVHRIVERRNTIPILSNVLIEARERPADAEERPISISRRPNRRPPTSRRTARPPFPPMSSTTSSASCPRARRCRLEMTGDIGQLLLRSGRARFHLQCLPASDFPDLTTGELSHRFALAGGRSEAADRQYAIRDLDRGDALLSQRHFLPHRSRSTARRCCARSRPTAIGSPASNCPRRKARRACPASSCRARRSAKSRSCSRTSAQEIVIEMSTAKARFQFGDVVLTTKLIDGTFPDYGRVIPANNDKRLVVDKEPFARGRSIASRPFRPSAAARSNCRSATAR